MVKCLCSKGEQYGVSGKKYDRMHRTAEETDDKRMRLSEGNNGRIKIDESKSK